jgi:hypothetical protein
MFTVQLKVINTRENRFYVDDPTFVKSEQVDFTNYIKEKLNYFNFQASGSRYVTPDNLYVIDVRHSYFPTIEQAKQFLDLHSNINETHSYRVKQRAWNHEHNILSEFNILDKDGKLVEQMTNCVENVCVRFGGSCDTDNGCPTVHFAKEFYKLRNGNKIIPIKSV